MSRGDEFVASDLRNLAAPAAHSTSFVRLCMIQTLPPTLYITFLAFPMVATKAFRAFVCIEFIDGSRFLEEDYSIDCNNAEQYTPIAFLGWVAMPPIRSACWRCTRCCSSRSARR